jgi:Pyruvate/2-oxoacid:ferredoxin oxidoreductase gamma subunit/ribosomal protein S18 acetylase RimI-like enzyme
MQHTIKKMKAMDAEAVVRLFHDVIDEIHAGSSALERMHYKDAYSMKTIEDHLGSNDSVYLVAKEGEVVVGFLFAGVSDGIGHIHWVGISKGHRRKGYARGLLDVAVKEFKKKHCHEAKLFTYPSATSLNKLLERMGFEEKAYIDEQFFGISVILMVKKLALAPAERVTKKIILAGEAGQGIKLMAHSLASILVKLGKEVSLNLLYDSAVRSGNITAELIYSDEKIEVPFFEKADLCLRLSDSNPRRFNAKKEIMDDSICKGEGTYYALECLLSDQFPFKRMASEQFGSQMFVNMIALGKLLKYIGIDIEKVNFESELPSRFLDENVKAIRYGYTYLD